MGLFSNEPFTLLEVLGRIAGQLLLEETLFSDVLFIAKVVFMYVSFLGVHRRFISNVEANLTKQKQNRFRIQNLTVKKYYYLLVMLCYCAFALCASIPKAVIGDGMRLPMLDRNDIDTYGQRICRICSSETTGGIWWCC